MFTTPHLKCSPFQPRVVAVTVRICGNSDDIHTVGGYDESFVVRDSTNWSTDEAQQIRVQGFLTSYTLHPTPCTLHPAPCTLHPAPCTLHPTPYTLHPTPYTLHPAPQMLTVG
ncbi:hypothetical protein T484DRAFT_1615400 [Baffinella frigidus]|nr:hypothetical protein T484DRAFT_1615400 [Cryptophyta sp. CCMP2293]